MRGWIAAGLMVLLPSCMYFTGDPTVLVTSTPPGAIVVLDGTTTEYTTPALLELDGISGDNHRITLQKPGYDPESRVVYHYSKGYTSRWIDGAADFGLPAFFIFWTLGDLFTPFAWEWRYVPHEVHVRLYEAGTGPVTTPEPTPDGTATTPPGER